MHSFRKSLQKCFTNIHELTLQSSFGVLCFSVSDKVRIHFCCRKDDVDKEILGFSLYILGNFLKYFLIFFLPPPKKRQRFFGETNGNNKKNIERNNKIWNQVKEKGENKFFKHLEIHVICFESLEP